MAGILSDDEYSFNGLYCTSFVDTYSNIILYVLIMAGSILTTYFYMKIVSILNEKGIKTKNSMMFPIIMYVSWLPWIASYILGLFNQLSFAMVAFEMVASHLQGLATAIFYGRSQFRNLKERTSSRSSRGVSMLDTRNFYYNRMENQQALLMSP
jgi:hypothetical protein